jgi:hypothetical protein
LKNALQFFLNPAAAWPHTRGKYFYMKILNLTRRWIGVWIFLSSTCLFTVKFIIIYNIFFSFFQTAKLDRCPMCRAPITSFFCIRTEDYLPPNALDTKANKPKGSTIHWLDSLNDRLTDFLGFRWIDDILDKLH